MTKKRTDALAAKIRQYTELLHRHKCYPGHHYTRIVKDAKRSKDAMVKSLATLTKGLVRCPGDKSDVLGLISYYNPKEHLPETGETLVILESALHRERLHPDYQYSQIQYRETSKRSPVFSYPRGEGWQYNNYDFGLNPPVTMRSNLAVVELRRLTPPGERSGLVKPDPIRTMSWESHVARPRCCTHVMHVGIDARSLKDGTPALINETLVFPGHREVYLPRQPGDNSHAYWSYSNGLLAFYLNRYAQRQLPF